MRYSEGVAEKVVGDEVIVVSVSLYMVVFFFFKQKTAYEIGQ